MGEQGFGTGAILDASMAVVNLVEVVSWAVRGDMWRSELMRNKKAIHFAKGWSVLCGYNG